MSARHAIAYAIVALMLAAAIAAIVMLRRKRAEKRRIMRGHSLRRRP